MFAEISRAEFGPVVGVIEDFAIQIGEGDVDEHVDPIGSEFVDGSDKPWILILSRFIIEHALAESAFRGNHDTERKGRSQIDGMLNVHLPIEEQLGEEKEGGGGGREDCDEAAD